MAYCQKLYIHTDSVFWMNLSSVPAVWLALLLIKAGDIKSNPGPTTHTPATWTCDVCYKTIHKNQTSIRCNHTLGTSEMHKTIYTPNWICNIHTHTHSTHPSYINSTPKYIIIIKHQQLNISNQNTTHSLTNNNQQQDKT